MGLSLLMNPLTACFIFFFKPNQQKKLEPKSIQTIINPKSNQNLQIFIRSKTFISEKIEQKK